MINENNSNRFMSKEDIDIVGKSAVNKSFGELGLSTSESTWKNKGAYGTLMESAVYAYSPNSFSEPDFISAEVELKLTPIKRNINGSYSAKERLVLNIINYEKEYKLSFKDSSFWHKNKKLYVMFYQWMKDVPDSQFIVRYADYLYYSEHDLIIIERDWSLIVQKIKDGRAHEISEADTLYLGACTKGSSSQSVRTQPFSDILAKQRAYCLKTSYMTQYVRDKVAGSISENLVSSNELLIKSFEEILDERLSKYYGMTQKAIVDLFSIKINGNTIGGVSNKNLNAVLLAKMLGIKGKVSETDEFKKANIVPKTINIGNNGKVKESMSFPKFDFIDVINETWDESSLRELFETTKYMFVIFKELNGQRIFERILFWNMPIQILENQLKNVWEETVRILKSGNISNISSSNRRTNNFPGMRFNGIAHVRPHGINSHDVSPLPVRDVLTGSDVYTKQCFWLNKTYIEKIIGI